MQTSYSQNMPVGLAGALADNSPHVSRSFVTAAAIPFGSGLVLGASADEAKLPASGTDKFVGVALLKPNVEQTDAGVAQYAAKDTVNVITRGVIWVKVEETIAAGDPAFVRHTASGGNTTLGLFRNDADTSTCLEVKGAVFRTAAAAGALAQLELNLPA